MIRKLIQLEDQFATGEPTTRPVILWGANGHPLREQVKTASDSGDTPGTFKFSGTDGYEGMVLL